MKSTYILLLIISLSRFFSFSADADTESLIFSDDFSVSTGLEWNLESGWMINDGELVGSGHVWASTIDNFNQEQFRVSFTLRLQQGGLHFNLREGSVGRYYIGLSPGVPATLNKQYYIPDTFLNNLASGTTILQGDQVYSVECQVNFDSVTLFIDGELQWTFSDSNPLSSGKLAFESLESASIWIDDFMVYAPKEDLGVAWITTGGPSGGLGYDIRMHPNDPQKMFVTDANAGVFVSQDSGITWQSSNEGINTRVGSSNDLIPVFCLSIDPNNPDTLWTGTAGIRGIFKSTDQGQTWVRKDAGIVEDEGITLRGFTVKPGDSNTVYAAAEINSWTWAGEGKMGREFDMTQGVVYKTINGGDNWQAVWRGNNLARYILIDPTNTDTIYVSTGIFDREAANSVPDQLIGGGEGVIKSIDGGQTWSNINQGLDNLYVGSLYMHPDNPNTILAGAGNNQYHENGGIYLTTDGGNLWQQVLSDDIITSVEYSENNPNIAYGGSIEAIYRSNDGGASWNLVGKWEWGPDGIRAGFPIDFQIDPNNPNRLFINNYGGGNFLTIDGGDTWISASVGYTGAQVRALSVNPQQPEQLYVAARSGLFKTDDGGRNWSGLNKPPVNALEWNLVQIDPGDHQHLLASHNHDNVIYQSVDGGVSWSYDESSRLKRGFFDTGPNKGWRALAFAPSNTQQAYAGSSAYISAGSFDDDLDSSGIYRTDDGGNSWYSANDVYSSTANVAAIDIDSSNADRVFVASTNKGIMNSINGGINWQMLSEGLPSEVGALSVAINPNDLQTVFAGFIRGGLYQSTDGGTNWAKISSGLPAESSITSILFHPDSVNSIYIADKDSGVYHSNDGGNRWQAITNQLSNKAVNALDLSHDGSRLYAATEGGGVFRLDMAPISNVVDSAISYILEGSGSIAGEDIQHPNGNIFDQVLLTGESIKLQAKPGHITRVSFMDEDEDIVQVEYSGAGTFTVTLDSSTYLAAKAPPRYNQSGVEYVTGKPSVVIEGADSSTYFSIFTVGKINAVNQALFPEGQEYGAQADVSLLEVTSSTGMGGMQLSNTVFSGSTGKVGIDARGVPIAVRLTVGDIDASGDAVPHLLFGSGSFTVAAGNPGLRITGGDLAQTNAASVVVAESGSTTTGFETLISQNNFKSDHTAQPTLSIDATFANEDGDAITVTTEELTIE